MRYIDVKDRTPVGDPETIVDLGPTVLLGLHVQRSYGGSMGMLAVKCERVGEALWPVSLAITDGTLASDTAMKPLQSNPKRVWDSKDDDRSDGA